MHERTSAIWPNGKDLYARRAIPPAEVQAQLQRILESSIFGRAPRHRRFLSFVVNKTLSGEGEALKEYLIALEVFDRTQDFDPASDPVVRSEARRLRLRLANYYGALGKLDPIHVDLPKGTYVPVFYRNGVEPPVEQTSQETAAIAGQRDSVVVRPRYGSWRRRWLAAGAGVVVIASLSGGAYWIRSRKTATKFTDKDTIVLADFVNRTGDPVFDDTLKTALSVALSQSPFLNILSDTKVAATLQLMERPVDTSLTSEVATELCLRAGAKAYIAGSIAPLGTSDVLTLKAVNCENGDVLAQEQVTATAKEGVLDALGDGAIRLRRQLGESLTTVQKYDVRLVQATTSSLEALKAYGLGLDNWGKKGVAAALPHLQLAVHLDPNFALAYMTLGSYYFSLAELARANDYYARAFQLRDNASALERLEITAAYYENVTGEQDKAAQTYQELIDSYPRYGGGYFGLAMVYDSLGQYERAVEAIRQAQRLAPGLLVLYESLASSLTALERFEETRQVIHEAQTHKFDDFLNHSILYALAFLEADSTGMAEQQKWFADKATYENLGLALASDTEAYSGHLHRAEDLTAQARDSAIRADSKESGAIWLENSALREAAFGNSRQARRAAAAGLQLAPASQGAEVEAALTFAMAGDVVRAESLVQDLEQRFPLDTQLWSLWLPAIRAQLSLDRRNPAAALEHLRTAVPPLALGQIMFVNNISCLYPLYIRGQAYLASGGGSAAAAEFQEILNHSGTVWNCWTGALAHLGLARANALQAETLRGANADAARARAVAAYNDFLTLWKDADPNIPILVQAKVEYAKLQ